ncbi:DUF6042 family protein [Streptomyces halstedii]|uniref:DUF6042 family protein n=1 Tax=Streptomyces halstedii TaxID=1944 RepID=UPI003357978E
MTKNPREHDVIPREVAIANARRVLDAARARRDRDRALGRLPQQVEFMLRRLEREQLGQPATGHPAVAPLLLHCAHGWEHSDGATHTSLQGLEQATSLGEADLRDALHRLATAGEAQLYYGNPRTPTRAADLATRTSFVLVADWQRINSNRPRPV